MSELLLSRLKSYLSQYSSFTSPVLGVLDRAAAVLRRMLDDYRLDYLRCSGSADIKGSSGGSGSRQIMKIGTGLFLARSNLT
jgi:hypothetical protein